MPAPRDELFFAAVGDVHGDMRRMVRFLEDWTERHRRQLDFVLQVGDFEPHRDEADLATMAAPAKYRHLGDFPAFHQHGRGFPWPLYFIGGNHEPYGYLDSHPEGFELLPGCHYLGRVGAVELRGLRVAGLSGIHRDDHFHLARPPVSQLGNVSNKDFAWFNEHDVDRALELGRADVLLVHDWPSGIIDPADAASFEHQRRSASHDTVGNDYARLIAEALKPKLVLCGHLHRAYRGVLPHASGPPTQVCCLASVAQGSDAFAVFRASGGAIEELTASSV
jgi:predicted phosphodiesterase